MRQDGWDEWLPYGPSFAYKQSHPLLHATHGHSLSNTGPTSSYGVQSLCKLPTKVEAVFGICESHEGHPQQSTGSTCEGPRMDIGHVTITSIACLPPTFAAGDKVFLDASNIHTTWPLTRSYQHCFPQSHPQLVHPVGSHAYPLATPTLYVMHPPCSSCPSSSYQSQKI